MRGRTVIALAVVAGLLTLWVLLDGREAPSAGGEGQRLLGKVAPTAITSVTIGGSGRRALTLRRDGETFVVEGPSAGPADPAAARKVLATLEFLESQRELPKARGFRQLGLAPAKLSVSVRVRGSKEPLVLRFGHRDASQRGVYARVGAGPAVVVAASAYESLDVEARDLRDRALVPLAAAAIDALDLGDVLTLRRGRDGRFRLGKEASSLLADPGDARRLVGAAAALMARRFLSARSSVEGGLLLRLASGKRSLTSRILGACPGRPRERVVASRGPAKKAWQRACVDAADVEPLLAIKGPAEVVKLRDTVVSRVRAADVEGLSIKGPSGETLRLERRGAGWRYQLGEKKGDADDELIDAAVDGLGALKGRVEVFGAGQEKPITEALGARSVSVELVADKRRTRLVIGETKARGTPAKSARALRRGAEAGLLWIAAPLPAAVARLLQTSVDAWRDHTLLRIPSYEVRALTIQRRGESRERVEKKADGWALVRPSKAPADTELVKATLKALSRLRAVRFLASPPAGDADVRLEALRERRGAGGKTTKDETTLKLWRRGDEGCAASVDGNAFWLSATVCKTLSRRLVTRRPLASERGAVKRIELRLRGQRGRTLVKTATGWVESKGNEPKGKTIPATTMAAFLDALLAFEGSAVAYPASHKPIPTPNIVLTLKGGSTRGVHLWGAQIMLAPSVTLGAAPKSLEALNKALRALSVRE